MKTYKFIKRQEEPFIPASNIQPVSENHLKQIKAGDFIRVKIANESFWVEVEVLSDEGFLGNVNNVLLNDDFHKLQLGSMVEISWDEVLDIIFLDPAKNEKMKKLLTP